MRRSAKRFTLLVDQQASFKTLPPLALPLRVLTQGEPTTVSGTWSIFKPAFPLTLAGLVYGLAGGCVAFLFSSAALRLFGRRKQSKSDQALNRALNDETSEVYVGEGRISVDAIDYRGITAADESPLQASDVDMENQSRNGPADPESSRG